MSATEEVQDIAEILEPTKIEPRGLRACSIGRCWTHLGVILDLHTAHDDAVAQAHAISNDTAAADGYVRSAIDVAARDK